jgi:hypothetical protein
MAWDQELPVLRFFRRSAAFLMQAAASGVLQPVSP